MTHDASTVSKEAPMAPMGYPITQSCRLLFVFTSSRRKWPITQSRRPRGLESLSAHPSRTSEPPKNKGSNKLGCDGGGGKISRITKVKKSELNEFERKENKLLVG